MVVEYQYLNLSENSSSSDIEYIAYDLNRKITEPREYV